MKKKEKVLLGFLIGIPCAAILSFLIWFFYTFISFLAGGFNSIMIEELGNKENYITATLTYQGSYFREGTVVDSNGSLQPSDINYMLYIKCLYDWSGHPNADDIYAGTESVEEKSFEIFKDNALILLQNGFFEDIKQGDEIIVKTSLWRYWDNEFNFIAEVRIGDKIYLDFEEGFNNILNHMYSLKC